MKSQMRMIRWTKWLERKSLYEIVLNKICVYFNGSILLC